MRNAEIGNKDFELDVLEEAYTSEHWIVRIYKVSMRIVFSSVVGRYLTMFINFPGQRFAQHSNRGTR